MKSFLCTLLVLLLFCVSCSETPRKLQTEDPAAAVSEVPNITIEIAALEYHAETSLWTLNDIPFSGFALSYYKDGGLQEKFGILNGKKQGKHVRFYADGHFKSVAEYNGGKLHGEKKLWAEDTPHILIAHYRYWKGKPHGEQKKWYPTGELFKIMRLNQGKEEGIQQAFRKNGAIYANYEARNGRIFGLKKAKLCYSLVNENVQTKKKQRVQ